MTKSGKEIHFQNTIMLLLSAPFDLDS